ncbi:hypothetical protein [Algoriphagus chordae]|uniref:Uncharacterized protein n=1 Tax=Algoriphagus chordae TaxID=237019 RepID=A0A2W7R6T4_9BACT|nr:hypothetical protein [Algoriphagus chordae]PZX55851.1 hypothetical protein LV85_01076 [Algoriphagus chordae]
MKTIEVKRMLIQKIEQINDPKILDEVNRLLEFDLDSSEKMVLSNDQLKAVEEGRAQYFSAQIKSNDQLDGEIEEWLRK